MAGKDTDLSVVISTFNRSEMLPAAVRSVLEQEAEGVNYEVIVVDNNSTDETREVLGRMMREPGAERLRCVFEAQQGLSHARNTGIREARGDIIAFTDDDVRAANDWVIQIKRAFDEHPEVDYVGGKVLPLWNEDPPSWLTSAHWSPLALVDYGEREFHVNSERAVCLIGANMSFRRRVFDEFGGFAPAFQRVKDGIGSTEDDEFQSRLRRAGRQGLYIPTLLIRADVQADRQTKAYHRRWHAGHGRFTALMRVEHVERSTAGRLFDVPAHLYRQAFRDAAQWLRRRAAGNRDAAFDYEVKLRFFAGFFRQRRRDYAASGRGRSALRELAHLGRALLAKKN